MDCHTPFLERASMLFHADEERLRECFRPDELSRLLRLRDIHGEMLRNPMRPDNDMVRWIQSRFGLKERQARYDVADLRAIVGVIKPNKDAERYEVSQWLRKSIMEAEQACDRKAAAAFMKEYIRVNRLDKDEAEPIDPARIYPLPVAPTCDVGVLGLTPKEEDLKEKLRARYGKGKLAYQDAQIVEEEPDAPDPIENTPTRLKRTLKAQLPTL